MMFSKVLANLRSEAERISGANAELLADSLKKNKIAYEYSGSAAKDKVLNTGLGLGTGGAIGIMGMILSNPAATINSSGFLINGSNILASLGVVTVGVSTVLPVTAVIAFGASIVGIATIGVGIMMKENLDKGDEFDVAAMMNDRSALNKLGRENPGIGDWLSGAKNLVVKSIQENLLNERSSVMTAGIDGYSSNGIGGIASRNNIPGMDAEARYAFFLNGFNDSLSENSLDIDDARQYFVANLADEILVKYGVIVSNESIDKVLGRTQENASYSGKLLAVDERNGLVIQSLGRGQGTIHNLKDFSKSPVIGQSTDIVYKGGKMQDSRSLSQERNSGQSVDR